MSRKSMEITKIWWYFIAECNEADKNYYFAVMEENADSPNG